VCTKQCYVDQKISMTILVAWKIGDNFFQKIIRVEKKKKIRKGGWC